MTTRILLAAALAIVAAPRVHAACSSAACPDVVSVDNVRSTVAAACDCIGTKSHGAYVRCAKDVIKAAVKNAQLTKSCKGTALRCEAQSSCGKKNTGVCCSVRKSGKVKAKLIRTAAACRSGNTCDGQMSIADACTDTGTCAAQRRGIRSFRSVQAVFKTSCALASCHSTFSRQGELVLDSEDISYTSLVGRDAALADAKQAGLLRVKPYDPANSFLIRKLRGQGPGTAMPQTGNALPEPVINMIEDWIARGALSSADECKQASTNGSAQQYCDDEPQPTGNYVWKALDPLPPPAPGTGIQLHVPPRPVDAGTEWETCYAFKPDWEQLGIARGLGLNPLGQQELPVISQQTYRMHPGSHHLLLYAYLGQHPEGWKLNQFFPCFAASCLNPGDCPDDAEARLPIGGTQVAGTSYEVKYPDGVGIPTLSKDTVLIANLHYTNPFLPQQPIYGEAWLNLQFYAENEFKVLLNGIFAINYDDLFIQPYQTRTISRIWQPQSILPPHPPEDAAVFQLFGHMHKRGTEFRIDYVKGGTCSVGGALCGRDSDCGSGSTCTKKPSCTVAGATACSEDTTIYYTTQWDHAPVVDFPSPYFRVNQDEGLRWTCTHQNGIPGDPTHPPKRCTQNCNSCGWTGGRCSTNGKLCRPGSQCAPDETCQADPSGVASSGFVCKNAKGRPGNACCPGDCTASDDAQVCWFTRGVELGFETAPHTYQPGDPMPVVFGELADDDMCNMFGYFINKQDLPKIGLQ